MRLMGVLTAQAIRLVETHAIAEEQRRPLWPLLKELEARYYFLQIPHKLEDFNFATGVTFLSGMFDGKVIDKFQIYERGVLCETKTSTEHCDFFIDDLLVWAAEKELQIYSKESPDRGYWSSVEVHMDNVIESGLNILSHIGSQISKKLRTYGLESMPDYIPSGFKLYTDTTGLAPPVPGEFAIERRVGQPYSSSIYISWGPLRTNDHLDLLAELESVLVNPHAGSKLLSGKLD
jgi:hypothetical protein